MADPIITGAKQARIEDMYVGDYIYARYTVTADNKPGIFSEIGTVSESMADFDIRSTTLEANRVRDGKLMLMKISTGALVSRSYNVFDITPPELNQADLVYGKKYTIGGRDFLIRLVSPEEHRFFMYGMNGVFTPAQAVPFREVFNTIVPDTLEWLGGYNYEANMLAAYYYYHAGQYKDNYAIHDISIKHPTRFVLQYIESPKSKNLYC